MTAPTERRAEPGDLCTCGRQAVLVLPSERRPGGVVGYCGLADGGALVLPCPWCGTSEAHRGGYGESVPCPEYTLRAPAHTGTDSPVRPAEEVNGVRECVDCGHDFDPDSSPHLDRCWSDAERFDAQEVPHPPCPAWCVDCRDSDDVLQAALAEDGQVFPPGSRGRIFREHLSERFSFDYADPDAGPGARYESGPTMSVTLFLSRVDSGGRVGPVTVAGGVTSSGGPTAEEFLDPTGEFLDPPMPVTAAERMADVLGVLVAFAGVT